MIHYTLSSKKERFQNKNLISHGLDFEHEKVGVFVLKNQSVKHDVKSTLWDKFISVLNDTTYESND